MENSFWTCLNYTVLVGGLRRDEAFVYEDRAEAKRVISPEAMKPGLPTSLVILDHLLPKFDQHTFYDPSLCLLGLHLISCLHVKSNLPEVNLPRIAKSFLWEKRAGCKLRKKLVIVGVKRLEGRIS